MNKDDTKYRIFFENSADAMLIIEDGKFVDCNSATVSMLGYDRKEELFNTPPFKLSPEFQPDGISSLDKADEMMCLARERGNHQFEWDHLKKDGSIIPVEVSLTAIENSHGSSLHTVWRNISDRKQTEKNIRDSEHRFHTIFETIPDVVAITRICDGTIIDINPAYELLTGFNREQLIGRSSVEFGSWVNIEDREKMMEQVLEKGFVRNMEAPMRTIDNLVREALISAQMINLHGEPHLLTIFKDISDRVRSQRALKDSEECFRQVFEANPDPVILACLDGGKFLDANKAFETLTGITRLEAIGHNSADLGLWDNMYMRTAFLDCLHKNGEVNNYEAELRVSGGQLKTGLLSARLISINHERCILIVVRDISTEKEVERALLEMDRMKNEFISTAAHELRTPVASIMGYTEMLSDDEFSVSFNEEQKNDFHKEIHDNSERLAKIIDDILDVSRIEAGQSMPLDKTPTSTSWLLDKVVKSFKLISKQNITLDVCSETPETIKIDPNRVIQVIENLLSNSIKYSSSTSNILIRAEKAEDFCKFSVIDQGIGMNEEQRAKIFDKFYRADGTDTAVRGLGLGMNIVKQIIENHGGSIWIDSSIGVGTKVYFQLPIG